MGEGRKRGPDRGSRKRRAGKIAGSKAEGAVKECLLNGGTLTEASRIITDIEGKNVSKESVSRYYHRLVEAAERAQMTESLARALAGGTAPASGRNVAGAARRMLLVRAVEAAAALAPEAMEKLPPDRLALLVCSLGRAEADADRHRWETWRNSNADGHSRHEDLHGRAARPPLPDLGARLREMLGLEAEEDDPEEDGPDLEEDDPEEEDPDPEETPPVPPQPAR